MSDHETGAPRPAVPGRAMTMKDVAETAGVGLGTVSRVLSGKGQVSAATRERVLEAARSLGAGWGTVMWRVVLPNIRSAVLSAAFLTVALVLGEFTIASLLNRTNLQVAINLLGKSSATMSVAVSLTALLLAFVLLLLLSLLGGRRRTSATVAPAAPAADPSKETTA